MINYFHFVTSLVLIFQMSMAFGQMTEKDTVFVKSSVGNNEFEIDTLFIQRGISTPQVLVGTRFYLIQIKCRPIK